MQTSYLVIKFIGKHDGDAPFQQLLKLSFEDCHKNILSEIEILHSSFPAEIIKKNDKDGFLFIDKFITHKDALGISNIFRVDAKKFKEFRKSFIDGYAKNPPKHAIVQEYDGKTMKEEEMRLIYECS